MTYHIQDIKYTACYIHGKMVHYIHGILNTWLIAHMAHYIHGKLHTWQITYIAYYINRTFHIWLVLPHAVQKKTSNLITWLLYIRIYELDGYNI